MGGSSARRALLLAVDEETALSSRTVARRLSTVSGLFSYLLARGDVGKKLTVQAHKFSGKAAEKIAAAGGAAEVLSDKKQEAAETTEG